jgi:hypothetical protein
MEILAPAARSRVRLSLLPSDEAQRQLSEGLALPPAKDTDKGSK